MKSAFAMILALGSITTQQPLPILAAPPIPDLSEIAAQESCRRYILVIRPERLTVQELQTVLGILSDPAVKVEGDWEAPSGRMSRVLSAQGDRDAFEEVIAPLRELNVLLECEVLHYPLPRLTGGNLLDP